MSFEATKWALDILSMCIIGLVSFIYLSDRKTLKEKERDHKKLEYDILNKIGELSDKYVEGEKRNMVELSRLEKRVMEYQLASISTFATKEDVRGLEKEIRGMK